MSNVFFTSDLHFGHEKLLNYEPARKYASIEEHDEAIIANINSLVGKRDFLWILGDLTITMNLTNLQQRLSRLNGTKMLVLGNHDRFCVNDYLVDFVGVYAYAQKYNLIMSHIPVHTDEVGRWGLNVHGHLHSRVVTKEVFHDWPFQSTNVPDTRYLNVGLERNNMMPFSLEEIREYQRDNQ